MPPLFFEQHIFFNFFSVLRLWRSESLADPSTATSRKANSVRPWQKTHGLSGSVHVVRVQNAIPGEAFKDHAKAVSLSTGAKAKINLCT